MRSDLTLRATAIGSMPHPDASPAVDLLLESLETAPFWPQLPKRSLREQMEIQYSEGLPRIQIDEEKSRMFFDTTGDYSEELAEFYEGYLEAEESGDCSVGAISIEYSAGIPALEAALKNVRTPLPFIKCQTTGPISFALTIVDEAKRAIYYNEEFVDTVVKGLAIKCRWQIQLLQKYAEQVICFIDEPILSAFGSSTYVSVQRDDVVAKLSEVVEAIHCERALAGIHCCGNTEWSIPVDTGVEIVNFDAYEYGETIALYPEAIRSHLKTGNYLAWGIVPTSTMIREETVESLAERFENLVEHLAAKTGLDKDLVIDRALLTPSCGTGSMEIADAERVFLLLKELSESLRNKYLS